MSFLHDSNSRHDVKMLKLWNKFGYEGIGIFWCIVEILREQPNFKFKISDIELLSIELRINKVLIKDLITFCLSPETGLFKNENESFFSESLLRRMEKFKESRFRMSAGGKLGMERRYSKGVSKVLTSRLQGGNKVIEKKLTKTNSFLKPKIEEIRAYILEKKYNVNAEAWLARYESNGWMVGKNKMKSWKATIAYWHHNDFAGGVFKNKITPLPNDRCGPNESQAEFDARRAKVYEECERQNTMEGK